MFVITDSPLPPGTRLRLEVPGTRHSFIVEGLSVHLGKRRSGRVEKMQGMGVRFLPIEELVAEILPAAEAPDGGAGQSPEVYAVSFRDHRQFVEVFERDIVNGGIFVSTTRPPALNQRVVIELHVADDQEPLSAPALVVQRFDRQGQQGPNLIAGMWVSFIEPQHVVRRLQPLLGSPGG